MAMSERSMSVQQSNFREVREHLVTRRTQLVERRDRVRRDLARQLEALAKDSDDRAIQLQNDETLEEIGQVAMREIAAIDAALKRLELGLYGRCSVCDEAIEPRRLAAVPHTVTCSSCGSP